MQIPLSRRVGFMDMMEVTLWVYTGGIANSTKKITIKMGTEMVTSAYINWQVNVLINMIGGMTYEEAVKNVDYGDVVWKGMTAAIKADEVSASLDCLNASIEAYKKSKELNFKTSKQMIISCSIELFKSAAFQKLIKDTNSPYSKMLKKLFKNKKMREIQENIMTTFNCSYSDTYQFLRLIPQQILDSLIKG